jgi:hypothetical protein
MDWVFIQRSFSGSVHSCVTARGQKQAFRTDAVTQLCGLMTKKGLGLNREVKRQKVLLAETEQVNRADTRCARAAHFQRSVHS